MNTGRSFDKFRSGSIEFCRFFIAMAFLFFSFRCFWGRSTRPAQTKVANKKKVVHTPIVFFCFSNETVLKKPKWKKMNTWNGTELASHKEKERRQKKRNETFTTKKRVERNEIDAVPRWETTKTNEKQTRTVHHFVRNRSFSFYFCFI